MKTNNRPTEKYSYRTFDGEHKTELIPISDAKYIKLLEKENQELQEANNLLATDYNKLKALTDKVDLENHSLLNEGKQLYKENQELKLHMIDYKKVLDSISNVKDVYKDQFLKVVESVLYEHTLDFDLMCMKSSCDHATKTYREHLLQEIKSAIEKGKDDC